MDSRKKRDAVFDYLRLAGGGQSELAAIKTPAGIDSKAKAPNEVAISILAKMYKGETVYFCCDGCKVKFEAEPARYLPSLSAPKVVALP